MWNRGSCRANSITCDTLYMLGANMLVAHVMHTHGHVYYYLPAGEWTNILSDEVAAGNAKIVL